MRSSSSHGDLVLGGDIGGTSTRILVVDRTGATWGRGTAAGGNPTSHPDSAAAALAEALAKALAAVDGSVVRAAVVGLAGGGALLAPDVRQKLARAWAESGVAAGPTYVGDLDVAFASGTPEADGTVLIAGTGAAAGSVRTRRVVRTAGGHGWLLGDEGSGFWLGREAVRATLRALDLAQPLGPLAASVLQALDATPGTESPTGRDARDRLRRRLVQAVNSQPPINLAKLAPLVSASHEHDPVAADIVDRAARLLCDTIEQLRDPSESSPLVLAGSVASADSPVGGRLRDLVSARFAGPVLTARDGLGGAAWLALASVEPTTATAAVRERLVTG
jgi:N-acetylglucosamine kinase-like BadF-type ATPase